MTTPDNQRRELREELIKVLAHDRLFRIQFTGKDKSGKKKEDTFTGWQPVRFLVSDKTLDDILALLDTHIAAQVEEAEKRWLQNLLSGVSYKRGSRFTKKQIAIMEFVLSEQSRTGENPPVAEIGQKFGLADSTVSQHLSSIRGKINTRLETQQ